MIDFKRPIDELSGNVLKHWMKKISPLRNLPYSNNARSQGSNGNITGFSILFYCLSY